MIQEVCANCGGNDFIVKGNYKICSFCNTKYKIKSSSISIQSDIEILLKKCKDEPWNARKYANLILDIDPTNSEAKKYL